MTEHKVTVEYTIDDGIWLFCSCGWEHCCGFSPAVDQLVKAEQEHKQKGDTVHVALTRAELAVMLEVFDHGFEGLDEECYPDAETAMQKLRAASKK